MFSSRLFEVLRMMMLSNETTDSPIEKLYLLTLITNTKLMLINIKNIK